MEIIPLHDWPKNPNEALQIQQSLRAEIIVDNDIRKLEYITAIDTAFNDKSNRLYAAAVTVKYPELVDVEREVAEMEAEFPYIPALLAFREGPVILKALSKLKTDPDVIIFPGHGIAHPRGFGMASHLGLLINTPSIGCARKLLCGDFRNPPPQKGGCSSLFVGDLEVGFVYRTKENVKPMFISPGHRCGIREALDIIVRCVTEYRMPEPLRLAHLFANKYKQTSLRRMRAGRKIETGPPENAPDK